MPQAQTNHSIPEDQLSHIWGTQSSTGESQLVNSDQHFQGTYKDEKGEN